MVRNNLSLSTTPVPHRQHPATTPTFMHNILGAINAVRNATETKADAKDGC